MPIPVLLLARQLDLGGSERQLTQIARSLDPARFEVHVGCFCSGGVRAPELHAAGVPVACFESPSYRPWQALPGAWRLARYVRRRRIRLVHTFDVPTTIEASAAVRGFSGAVLLTSQRGHRELSSPAERRLLRITDRLAHGVVVNCEFLQRHLAADEHVPARKIRLCYNGLDVDMFSPGPSARPPQLAGAPAVVGTACVLRPEKDVRTLLQAFASLRAAHPGVRLLVVGDGMCLADLRQQADQLGVGGDCIFQPGIRDIATWLHAMDIFVLPSRTEALSNALMEAMACGCCPVASRVGGNPELIAHGQTGLLFQAGDHCDLAALLEALLRNEAQRRQLAGAAAQFVRGRFSLVAAAARMQQIYADFLGIQTVPENRTAAAAAGRVS